MLDTWGRNISEMSSCTEATSSRLYARINGSFHSPAIGHAQRRATESMGMAVCVRVCMSCYGNRQMHCTLLPDQPQQCGAYNRRAYLLTYLLTSPGKMEHEVAGLEDMHHRIHLTGRAPVYL